MIEQNENNDEKLEQCLKILDNSLMKITELTLRISSLEKILVNQKLLNQEELVAVNNDMINKFLAEYKDKLTELTGEK
jgi:hypothetical protein